MPSLAILDLGGQGLEESLQGLHAQVTPVAVAHGDGARLGLPVPDDQHVGHLGQLGLADLGLEALVAGIQLCP